VHICDIVNVAVISVFECVDRKMVIVQQRAPLIKVIYFLCYDGFLRYGYCNYTVNWQIYPKNFYDILSITDHLQ